MNLPPLSLYVHIPWCVRKCPYCDFNSHAVRSEQLPETEYVEALLEDLDSELAAAADRPLQSIFIGGGTPSLFSASAIDRILAGVNKRLAFVDDIEITMEANPGTFERERFADYRKAGVNRLSIGIQSFNDAALKALGRIHCADEAIAAASAAREIFPELNLDLMHGLPGQSPEGALADLAQAIELAPDHLSWYQLTIEPNTEFYSRPPTLPMDEALWEIQERGQARLADAGYRQYEVSAYAKPGHQARHNLNYWQFGDYIGIGAGAHGKLSEPTPCGLRIIRRHKMRQPAAYMDPARRIAGDEVVAKEDQPFEFMMNALRLVDGVDIDLLTERISVDICDIYPIMQEARNKGLLEETDTKIIPSTHGRLFLNDLLALFLE
ncbi:Radical SAM family enzyme, similar to coproporphyrinogen III oxidase, oxygen-independent, clustered with nucleoside-triphosphatase RdgB [Marinobacterium lacunae]|uniref:Heme chaperone HemW n=1 Tax=Marinobacterium lacunae TaxID=1232683 RepID=A0A081G340_9GAMM|nr:radical SAM family heme chaperone HemW [Marinobacterium lacunae]KEA65195.1 Radical SAM family enzyme, similar to coproporphyrinogen III oxidase, oxygen-independent, clustered with nucleoside-triphosphatase RdgB [Marinobacterium lacunae]